MRARERYPTSLLLRFKAGLAYLCAARPGEAEAEARRLLEAAPDSPYGRKLLGKTFVQTSRYEDAVTTFEEIRDDLARNPWEAGWIPYARAKAGDLVGAREMLDDLEASGFDYWYPRLYMALGQEDKAMAQIEAAFEVRLDVLLIIRFSPEYERLMEIPRFREIVEAIGFPY
jgi:tetratricopeptide (TPR) repeat protein